jgi:hypothetical protein
MKVVLMFVSAEHLEVFTGKRRPSAQARFLDRCDIKYIERADGTIALRQEELDRRTLTKASEVKRRRSLDLSLLRRAG